MQPAREPRSDEYRVSVLPASFNLYLKWYRARWLKRVFAIDMERCPVCQQGRLRIIAAIMEGSVIKKILRHLKLAEDPPPIAPAQQAALAWGS